MHPMRLKTGFNLYSRRPALVQFILGLLLIGASSINGQLNPNANLITPPDTLGMQGLQATQEAVKLSTQGAFTSLSPKVGDSLDYVLQVEWQDTQVPVIVLAPDSLHFEGFKVLGQATVHKKLAHGQEIRNHTEFIYRLRALAQGNGRATSIKLRYMTGISKAEEAVFVPTALVDILPASVKITEMLWFKLLAGLILFCGAIALAWSAFKITLKNRKASEPEKLDLKPEILALKNRLKSTYNSPDAAKEISLTMEGLAQKFLRQEIEALKASKAYSKNSPSSQSDTAATTAGLPEKFEPLLDLYLSLQSHSYNAGAEDSVIADWDKLRELFRHARFAGGYKEPHELQDAFRTFKRCLKITGEEEHE
jgi:uncharacterized membrane protein YecN with MAPEG domain